MLKNGVQWKVVCVIAAFLSFSACSTERLLHKTYTGPERAVDKVAVFNWSGTWYMGLGLYKVDGMPYAGGYKGGTWPCMYNGKNVGGFNVAVLPGMRVFEFFRVRNSPVSVFQLRFNMEAGKTYTLEGNEEKFVIKCDGKEVQTTVGPIPVYAEPLPGNPHAVLKLGGNNSNAVALFRLDGKVGSPMYKFHPKWVTMNEQTSFGLKEFVVRLSPGVHTIEYSVLSTRIGGFSMGFSVKTLAFNVKAGKNYGFKVIRDDVRATGDYEHTIEIIEE